jgi:hypothetical protein
MCGWRPATARATIRAWRRWPRTRWARPSPGRPAGLAAGPPLERRPHEPDAQGFQQLGWSVDIHALKTEGPGGPPRHRRRSRCAPAWTAEPRLRRLRRHPPPRPRHEPARAVRPARPRQAEPVPARHRPAGGRLPPAAVDLHADRLAGHPAPGAARRWPHPAP